METVRSADGTPIAFKRTGNGPPLVLVHGMAGNHTRWELFDVRPRLAEQTTVYAMDRRGHGESGDTEEYALKREFEDVAAVVDSIDEPVHLLGHSHGGLCVLEAALRTDNVASLIVYEPAGPWEEGHLYSEEMYEELAALVEVGENEQALWYSCVRSSNCRTHRSTNSRPRRTGRLAWPRPQRYPVNTEHP